jgi:predicted AAA+ superfamily ATPase
MKRHVSAILSAWRTRSDRKPLIVRGARQVGKTWSVMDLGRTEFQNVVSIDFERDRSACAIFAGDLSPKSLVRLIELQAGCPITPGTTLLFLDEIQCCPRALTALRYFQEEMPELHVVAAGSLLEFEMSKISFPVGRVEFHYMFPLTFGEFLCNTGKESLEQERPSIEEDRMVHEFVHGKLMDALREYMIVGGLPDAVKQYAQTQSLQSVSQVHDSIISSYLQDVLKYERNLSTDSVELILSAIIGQIGSQIKYSRLAEGLSAYKVRQALHVLEKALVMHPIHSSSAQGLPLAGSVNSKVLKAVFMDVGLMQHSRGIPATAVLQAGDLMDIYQGALCEQFVGQELIAAGGSQNGRLFYWTRNAPTSNAEVDYLQVRAGRIVPIEVKNGPSGRLRSLHLFLQEHRETSEGIVLHAGTGGRHDRIHFCPLYSKV